MRSSYFGLGKDQRCTCDAIIGDTLQVRRTGKLISGGPSTRHSAEFYPPSDPASCSALSCRIELRLSLLTGILAKDRSPAQSVDVLRSRRTADTWAARIKTTRIPTSGNISCCIPSPCLNAQMEPATPLYNMAATSKHKMMNRGHQSIGQLTTLHGTIKGSARMLSRRTRRNNFSGGSMSRTSLTVLLCRNAPAIMNTPSRKPSARIAIRPDLILCRTPRIRRGYLPPPASGLFGKVLLLEIQFRVFASTSEYSGGERINC
jgi:hypothetical protein